jgi:hypothetical protein
LKPHERQNPSQLIIEILKKKHNTPNDRFRIKFFIKIISMHSSQREPPMRPCSPLIKIRGFPLLIYPFQGAVYLGAKLGKTLQGPSDLVGARGGSIKPMLTLFIKDSPDLVYGDGHSS